MATGFGETQATAGTNGIFRFILIRLCDFDFDLAPSAVMGLVSWVVTDRVVLAHLLDDHAHGFPTLVRITREIRISASCLRQLFEFASWLLHHAEFRWIVSHGAVHPHRINQYVALPRAIDEAIEPERTVVIPAVSDNDQHLFAMLALLDIVKSGFDGVEEGRRAMGAQTEDRVLKSAPIRGEWRDEIEDRKSTRLNSSH